MSSYLNLGVLIVFLLILQTSNCPLSLYRQPVVVGPTGSHSKPCFLHSQYSNDVTTAKADGSQRVDFYPL